jgi:hypothetical protein
MAIRALVINETDHWADFVKAKKLGGKICGVYLYHDDIGVHCCELTPSFECHFVEDVWDVPDRGALDESEIDGIDDEIRCAVTDQDVRYWHISYIRSLPERPEGSFELPEKGHTFLVSGDEEKSQYESDEEWMEAILEYARGNALA